MKCICPKGLNSGGEETDSEEDSVYNEKVDEIASAILSQYESLQNKEPTKFCEFIKNIQEIINDESVSNLLEKLEDGVFLPQEIFDFKNQFRSLGPNKAMLEALSNELNLQVTLNPNSETSDLAKTGKIVLLCGTSTAGKTSICKQAQIEAQKMGHSWYIDGVDIASERVWTEPNELNGVSYPSAENHFTSAMKMHDIDSETVNRATEAFGARTLSVAFMSRLYLGNPTVDKIELIPKDDIKTQAKNVHKELCPENQAKYSVDNIEDLLHIINNCPPPEEFISQHPYPPLTQLNEAMISQALNRAKNGESTIIDVVGNETINGQLMALQFKEIIREAGLPSSTGEVVIAHCPINTLTQRIDKRNQEAVKQGRLEDVRQAFFPFTQYGSLYERTMDPELSVGEVSRQDILDAAKKYGGKLEDVSSLLRNLGFDDDLDKVYVTQKTQGAMVFQTGKQTPQEIAEQLCSQVLETKSPAIETEKNLNR